MLDTSEVKADVDERSEEHIPADDPQFSMLLGQLAHWTGDAEFLKAARAFVEHLVTPGNKPTCPDCAAMRGGLETLTNQVLTAASRLAEDVHLAWTIDTSSGNTPFADSIAASDIPMWRGAGVKVARAPIETGATVPVTIGIQMPAEVEQHRPLPKLRPSRTSDGRDRSPPPWHLDQHHQKTDRRRQDQQA